MSGVLDTTIQSNPKKSSAGEALQELLDQCGSHSGVSIVLGIGPDNALSQSMIAGHTGTRSCRAEFGGILSAMPYSLTYWLLYDLVARSYFFDIEPAHRVTVEADGKKKLAPIQKPPSIQKVPLN